ncbi:MAG TPA: S53 family peptidase [Planctomycetaceae bacterium]|jgi:kumamolisin|nr:S53 family peptidase [Planctomycetaceae bacterium]
MTRLTSTLTKQLALSLLYLLPAAAICAPPATPNEARKVFKNSVIPLDAGPTLAAHALVVNTASDRHKNDKLEVLFALGIPKEARAQLEQKVLKGEVVDAATLAKDYSPKTEDVERLVKWCKDEGFEITHVTPDQSSVYVRGSVAQLEKSLQINMVRVSAKDGVTYNAARNAPSLPVAVGDSVQAIIGLQPFRRATKHSRTYHPASAGVGPTASIANAPPYLIKEVLKAYGADNLPVSGSGQRIAILIDRLPLDADTAHFWQKNQLPADLDRIEKVNLKNVTLPPEGEESMDVQWTSGIAPGAKVRVYASGSLAFVDLDFALDRILADAANDPSLRQLSISLGLGEQVLSPDGTLDGEVSVELQKFLRPAALGVNVFVSSGDGGSNPDQFGQSGGPLAQTEWQASCPYVVGVGGTSLRLSGDGTVTTETGWALSGGGRSRVFDRPSYQNRPGIPSEQKRTVPDVSLLADPETGAYVRVDGHDQQIGGTSLAAPVWAGFCALINEARTKAGKPTLPFLNPLLYSLKDSDHCFRDIVGNNNGEFEAVPGYDMVTGLGVPNVKTLAEKLTQ